MSVTTSQQLNADKVQAALPQGSAFSAVGAALDDAAAKTLTAVGTDDAALQAAITTAAGQFVDRAANQSALQQRAQNALTANATFLGIGSPTNAQTLNQVQTLTKECSALIRLLLGLLDSTSGT